MIFEKLFRVCVILRRAFCAEESLVLIATQLVVQEMLRCAQSHGEAAHCGVTVERLLFRKTFVTALRVLYRKERWNRSAHRGRGHRWEFRPRSNRVEGFPHVPR